jgi:hypothetical protein
MTLAFTSTVLAEIMEDIRIECKELDGKRMCKPISITDASPAAANKGAAKGTKNGSHVATSIPKSRVIGS